MKMETLPNFANLKHKIKMKPYITFLLFLISFFGYGQTQPIEVEWTQENLHTRNTYFEDINNELDKFVGTWKYEDTTTNTIFEITFTKLIHQEQIFDNYADELSAQFKLVVNGIEQYNTYATPCEDCFIPTGFSSFTEGYDANHNIILTPVHINMYVASIAEPSIEQYVLSSNLKLVYQEDIIGSLEQLVWTNKVSYGRDYVTDEIVNNYQMPLEMVLIKQ